MSKRLRVLHDFYELPQQSIASYDPQSYPGKAVLYQRGSRAVDLSGDDQYGWRGLIAELDVYEIPGDHVDMFREPGVKRLAECLALAMEEAHGKGRTAAAHES